VVGREAERDQLWEVLRSVQQYGNASAVVLRGGVGSGKSRLAQWLCERSHEIGGSESLRAFHSEVGGSHEGVSDMFARHFRLRGLGRAEAEARLERLLMRQGLDSNDEALALSRVLLPTSSAEPMGRDERHALIVRALDRLSRERPVVAWLDDAHWSPDVLELVQRVLRSQRRRPTPVLFVLTVEPDTLAGRPAEAALVADLLARPDAWAVDVQPLADSERLELVRRLLPLEPPLRRAVATRTDGNPLYAVQLIGSWVDRGLLEVGEDGFQLAPGQVLSLPDGLHTLWARRVETVLEGRGTDDGIALEIAAVLGQEVDPDEWRDVCRSAGVKPSPDLVDLLLDERLARTGPSGPEYGWALSHGMLRESLQRRAAEAGRLKEHHVIAARWLRSRPGARMAERMARHLVEGGRPSEALQPLLDAITRRIEGGELQQGEGLLAEFEALVDGGQFSADDTWRGWGWLVRVRLSRLGGDDAGFERWAGRLDARTDARGQNDLALALAFERARRSRQRGGLRQALGQLAALEDEASFGYDERLLARCLRERALVSRARGERADGQRLLHRSFLLFETTGDFSSAGMALVEIAEPAADAGDRATVEQLLGMARRLFERGNSRGARAAEASLEARLAEAAGDLATAIDRWAEAVQEYEQLGSPRADRAKLALGQAMVEAGQIRRSGAVIGEALESLEDTRDLVRAALARVSLLPTLAEANAWDRWDGCLLDSAPLLLGAGLADPRSSRCVLTGAEMARDAGDLRRASDARRLARSLRPGDEEIEPDEDITN